MVYILQIATTTAVVVILLFLLLLIFCIVGLLGVLFSIRTLLLSLTGSARGVLLIDLLPDLGHALVQFLDLRLHLVLGGIVISPQLPDLGHLPVDLLPQFVVNLVLELLQLALALPDQSVRGVLQFRQLLPLLVLRR